MFSRFVAALSLFSVFSAPAYAFRCGNHIVDEGSTRAEVLAYCGEPADITHGSIQRRVHTYYGFHRGYFDEGFIDLPVEYWTYNLGPNRLMQKLRFIDGVVVEIETLGYGYYTR